MSAGASASTALDIDRSLVTAEGAYPLTLVFVVDGSEQQLTVRIRIAATATPERRGPMIIAAFLEGGAGDFVLSGFEESDSLFADYGLAVAPRAHLRGIDFAIERVIEAGAALVFAFPDGSLVPHDDPRWRQLSEMLIERRRTSCRGHCGGVCPRCRPHE